MAEVAAAVHGSRVSAAAAESIGNGLGLPADGISESALAEAARQLIDLAGSLDPDRLFRRARELRDELDSAGVAEREQTRYLARGLKHFDLPNGMGRLTWDLDPETNTQVKQLFDRATSPRRGGVRFVSGTNKEKSERILADSRTTPQLASDVFLALLIWRRGRGRTVQPEVPFARIPIEQASAISKERRMRSRYRRSND